MTVEQITFDTLSYANKLKAAGFTDKMAEVQAKTQIELIRELTDSHLATKQDVLAVKEDVMMVKEDIMMVKEDVLVLKQDVSSLESKLEVIENRIITKLGSVMVAGIGLIATLLTIFQLH